jgi:hypothetical protein
MNGVRVHRKRATSMTKRPLTRLWSGSPCVAARPSTSSSTFDASTARSPQRVEIVELETTPVACPEMVGDGPQPLAKLDRVRATLGHPATVSVVPEPVAGVVEPASVVSERCRGRTGPTTVNLEAVDDASTMRGQTIDALVTIAAKRSDALFEPERSGPTTRHRSRCLRWRQRSGPPGRAGNRILPVGGSQP